VTASKPVLWHIAISHYNEKARWALDYKGVEFERRAPTPGAHMAVALWLTRGRRTTFPVLQIDGETIGDSTAIIAALERRFPDPALYPEDPGERTRALALEEFFDEEVAPHVRLLAFHEATRDPEVVERFTVDLLPGRLRDSRAVRAGAGRFFSTFAAARYGVKSEQAAQVAREKVVAGFARLESELGSNDYLVGDRFTVADLTAASLLYPVVQPPEGPRLPQGNERYEAFRSPLRDRRGYGWVEEMFKRHRNNSGDSSPAAPGSPGSGAKVAAGRHA